MTNSEREVGERLGALLDAARWGNLAAAEAALADADPALWSALDVQIRRRLRSAEPSLAAVVFRQVAADPLSAPLPGPRAGAVVLGACHPDGRVREAAVGEVWRLGDQLALPVLALRAADWVPQVRARARRACLSYLLRDEQAALSLVPLATVLRRRDQGNWLAERLDELSRAPRPPAVKAAAVPR